VHSCTHALACSSCQQVKLIDDDRFDGMCRAAHSSSAGQGTTTDGTTRTVVTDLAMPGFVDIHTHGRGGTSPDMADCWLDPAATTRLLPAMATTSLLASIVFCCGDVYGKLRRAEPMFAALAAARGRIGDGAVVEGVHAEGRPCPHS
jgi:N-acetylglucosamine-6-phosphate deacetylase